MKPINLKQYGLEELSRLEYENIDGGTQLSKWIKGLGWGAVLKDAFDHWEDIKKGFQEGWDIDKQHKK
jgi:hypothetical protein